MSNIYIEYCSTPEEKKVSDSCFDLSTSELLRELVIRFWNSNGIEFCSDDDLFTILNEVKTELQSRGMIEN